MKGVYAGYSLLGALSILSKRNRCRPLGTGCPLHQAAKPETAARANLHWTLVLHATRDVDTVRRFILIRHAPRQKALLLQFMRCTPARLNASN